jgi:uncharacterized coiled-coil DUF342 family protein
LNRWCDDRDALNLIIREKWTAINLLKNKRDEINQSVKNLKEDESLILIQLDAKNNRYIDLTKKSTPLSNMPRQNKIELDKQIKDLDWKIQTNPLSRIEEEEIISQIRHLEKQLLINRKELHLKKQKDELFSTIKELSIHRDTVLRQKIDCVKKSQEYHTKMFEQIKQVDKIKAEADLAHKNYIKFNNEVNEIHNHYLEVTNQIKNITHKIRKIKKETKRKNLDLMIEEQSKKAYEKLKQRKKLTLNEYILLRKKGLA